MEVFVGRDAELRGVLEALEEVRDLSGPGVAGGVVCDVVGINGIGKSTLLRHVQDEAPSLAPDVILVPRDLTRQYSEIGMRGDCGPGASPAALASAVDRSYSIMRASVELLRGRAGPGFAEFRHEGAEIHRRFRRFMADRDLSAAATTTATPQADRAQLRDFQRDLDAAFLDGWDDLGGRPVVITLDPFDEFVDDEFGHWLVRMCQRLPHTLSLLARVPTSSAAPTEEDSSRIRRFDLRQFDRDQVELFLVARFVGRTPDPEIGEILHAYTGGHPGGLELAAKLLLTDEGTITAPALRQLLDRLPDDPDRRWASLVHLIVDAVHDPVLRRAVDVTSVTRWFDDALLERLLELPEQEGDVARRAVASLRTFGLANRIDGDPAGTFRLVDFIRISLAGDLRSGSPRRWHELHRLAAEHYLDRLQLDEDVLGGGSYLQWYRYERESWQSDKRQWLHHSGQLTADRESVRAMFVLVFLEAFYWYASYVPFRFADRLLEDWERASRAHARVEENELANDLELAKALGFLLEHYPRGADKPRDAPWAEIRKHLLRVQDFCGLGRRDDLPTPRPHVARATALLKVFLAQTWRFSDPTRPSAGRYYRDALRLVDPLGDDWLSTWIVLETADLAHEAGRDDEARVLLTETVQRCLVMHGEHRPGDGPGPVPVQQWDFELLANVHRLRGDLCWEADDRAAAAESYGRAVESAYWFQGDPHPPDSYTQQFYTEITQRVLARAGTVPPGRERSDFLAAVASHGPPDGEEAGSPLPAGASDDELDKPVSTFMDAWRERREWISSPAVPLRALLPDPGVDLTPTAEGGG